MDIRELPSSPLPQYIDPELPTVVISECCLVYMDPENAATILRWIVDTFGKSGVGSILYEPIGGHDAFGRMMIRNLSVKTPRLPLLTPR
jgi:[phosphatase 2A protein]-leucine-carboxy methyltransferase